VIIVALLSFSVGYFLNEEKSLNRLCKNLGYVHEGWFLLYEQRGFFVFFALVFLSFFKSWGWSILVKNSLDLWFAAISMYVLGNIVSLDNARRFHFTIWGMSAGILWALHRNLFQALFTAVIVSCLIYGLLIKR